MATTGQRLFGFRVLLVDDHVDTLDIFCQVLTSAVVSAVRSAREAVLLLNSADVVVTDVAMPGADGVWLLDQIRAKTPQVPVIAVSGYAKDQEPRLAHANFDVLLLKPVDPWRLCEEIDALVRKRAAA